MTRTPSQSEGESRACCHPPVAIPTTGTRRGCPWRNRVHGKAKRTQQHQKKSLFFPSFLRIESNPHPSPKERDPPNPCIPRAAQRRKEEFFSGSPAPNRTSRIRGNHLAPLPARPSAMSFIFGKKKTPAGTAPRLLLLVLPCDSFDPPRSPMGSSGRNWASFWSLLVPDREIPRLSRFPRRREGRAQVHGPLLCLFNCLSIYNAADLVGGSSNPVIIHRIVGIRLL